MPSPGLERERPTVPDQRDRGPSSGDEADVPQEPLLLPGPLAVLVLLLAE